MKIVAIIQARMGSTRLPGKVMKKVLGKSLIKYQIERVQRSEYIDEIVIATTTKEKDLPIIQFCNQHSIPYYRGSEENVLSRYYEAAKLFNADIIVRLTSDCPIIDPQVMDQVIQYYLENNYDYVSNTLVRTYPRGMDTEVFSFDVLEKVYLEAKESNHKEHVTSYIYQHPEIFHLGCVTNDVDYSHHRWTVDTEEDFQLIKNIIEHLYPLNSQFQLKDVLLLLEEHPDWYEINAKVKQKKV
jgi:spore coat polysaccharide biosynthesis protein SpsF